MLDAGSCGLAETSIVRSAHNAKTQRITFSRDGQQTSEGYRKT